MWEDEVKNKSKLAVEVKRMEQQMKDATALAESYKRKLARTIEDGKTYKTKHGLQKRKISKLEDKIESYRFEFFNEERCRDYFFIRFA